MMEVRAAVYTADGRIDCEIDHARFGWIPFTARADDPEQHGVEIYQAALAAGPAPYVPSTPEELRATMQCSPAQMRLALHRAGLLATVQAIADSDPEASIVWEYATVILRDSPFIAAMKSQSGMTDTEIDALFITAAAI